MAPAYELIPAAENLMADVRAGSVPTGVLAVSCMRPPDPMRPGVVPPLAVILTSPLMPANPGLAVRLIWPLLPFWATTLKEAYPPTSDPLSTTTAVETLDLMARLRPTAILRSSVAPTPPVMVETAGKRAHWDTSEFGGGYEIPFIDEAVSELTEVVSNEETAEGGY